MPLDPESFLAAAMQMHMHGLMMAAAVVQVPGNQPLTENPASANMRVRAMRFLPRFLELRHAVPLRRCCQGSRLLDRLLQELLRHGLPPKRDSPIARQTRPRLPDRLAAQTTAPGPHHCRKGDSSYREPRFLFSRILREIFPRCRGKVVKLAVRHAEQPFVPRVEFLRLVLRNRHGNLLRSADRWHPTPSACAPSCGSASWSAP